MKNIYDEKIEQLYRLFDLVGLIKSQEILFDSFLRDNYFFEEHKQEINYENIGKRLVEYAYKRDKNDINESHLHLIMLANVSDLIMSIIELDVNEEATFFDLTRGTINVKDELERIFFDEEVDVDDKVHEFINYHINRLMYEGANDLINHDFNIEDWLIIDKNKIGLYLDNNVHHHYGCWIPEKFLSHLAENMRIPLNDGTKLDLFFKKKAYQGTIRLQEGKYMLCWDNTLRRLINKKYPGVFAYSDEKQTNERVLMSFFYHKNFEDNFIKIDFELVDM